MGKIRLRGPTPCAEEGNGLKNDTGKKTIPARYRGKIISVRLTAHEYVGVSALGRTDGRGAAEALQKAAEETLRRYPYMAVRLRKNELEETGRPFAVVQEEKTPCALFEPESSAYSMV